MSVKIDRTGETRVNNQGLKMAIVAYRSNVDIDVRFEDGYVKEHTQYSSFTSGMIKNPNAVYSLNRAQSRIGETNINHQGLRMTIIAYRSNADLTVRFDDGYTRDSKYCNFKLGKVLNPNAAYTSVVQHRGVKVGESNTNTQGHRMEIIGYENNRNITVKFDTGEVRSHINYRDFIVGHVPAPSATYTAKRAARIGETSVSTLGIGMSIVKYAGVEDITVKFDTGYFAHKVAYNNFCSGSVTHPLPYQIGSVVMDKFAYRYGNLGNFYCHCNKCGIQDIMTVQEMKDHKCIASD